MPPDPRAWVVLRLEPGSEDLAGPRLWYRDSTNLRFGFHTFEPTALSSGFEVDVPVMLGRRIEELAEMLPDIRGPHVEGPARVPVFLDLSQVERPSQWLPGLVDLVTGQGRAWPVQLGRPSHWARRTRFRLPFRVATLPGVEPAADIVRSSGWIRELGEREPYALVVEEILYDSGWRHVAGAAPDVVIGRTRDLTTALGAALETDLSRRPRLIVGIGDGAQTPPTQVNELPPGVSLLELPYLDPILLEELVVALVHDLPLHDAVADIARRTGLNAIDLPLMSDPYADHALRISDAQGALKREALELEPYLALRNRKSFLERLGPDAPIVIRRGLEEAATAGGEVMDAADTIRRSAPVDFGRESQGLYPLAEGELSLARSQLARERMDEILIDLARDPEVGDVLRRHQQRRVDIALASRTLDRLISQDTVLAAGGSYRLLVRVGGSFAESLFATPPPAIDPLLPDPPDRRGHELEIVLYPIDFTLRSDGVFPVVLPRFGASEIAQFTIEAPAAGDAGPANARVAIYHENHLVQSFMLRAEVGEQEGWRSSTDGGIHVELEFSRTERFENVEELGARAVSLAVNQMSSGTHRLTVKGDGIAQDLVFAESLLEGDIQRFRETLEEATETSPNVPRFPDDPEVGAERAAAEEYLRRLAREGAKLHEELQMRSGDVLFEGLRSLAHGRDKTIQIVRYDPNYALPWAAFYDFKLPREDAPVCLGVDENGAPCTHVAGVDLGLFCIYGFWGARHRIEQFLIPPDGNASAERKLTAVNGRPPTVVVLGVEDASTAALVQALGEIEPQFVEQASADNDVLDLVWKSATRPTCLVVVGHLDDASDLPRIVLSQTRILDGAAVNQRAFDDGRMQNPRPLVMLMACGSGATELTTHAGLSLAVWSAGAAAVVGTEATVFTSLVKRFVDELMNGLWHGLALGEAMTEFRRRRLQSANPLAFVFTSFGDADLKVEH